MVVRAVGFHSLAMREVQAAYRWYARRSVRTAQRFLLEGQRVLQRIADNAEHGTRFRGTYRWMRMRRFPYVFYYEINDPLPVVIYACGSLGSPARLLDKAAITLTWHAGFASVT